MDDLSPRSHMHGSICRKAHSIPPSLAFQQQFRIVFLVRNQAVQGLEGERVALKRQQSFLDYG